MQEFYGWWQLVSCGFAFVALLSIWWHIGKKRGDFGQVWLALSVLCWSLSGAVEIYFSHYSTADSNFILGGWRSILSLCNSLFILLALPWFRYIPARITTLVKSNYWYYIIGLPFLFSLIPMISVLLTGRSYTILSELDMYYALLTLVFLGYVLHESFAKRRLYILAYLSILCVLITLYAQLMKLTGNELNQMLISSIFKTCLIMLFFALALSWVKDLIEEAPIHIEKLRAKLFRHKNQYGRYDKGLDLEGLNQTSQSIPLTSAAYELIKKFAQKKHADDQWLEIKPKSEKRGGKRYDIQDYNELKRLLHALLDGIYGKGCWTQEKHALPLKAALFEQSAKRDRKIRLRISKDQVTLSH